jgi:HK97 family phage major capsid protein
VISLLDADDLIDLYHAIPYQYRDNAVWLIHDQTIKSVRKLRENGAASGNFMWQPGLQAGQPDRILGRPVYPLNTMASTGSGNPIIAFGDPRFFWVADFNNGGFDFQVLNELYALSAAVGYWFWKRFDSHLMVSEAVRGLYLR